MSPLWKLRVRLRAIDPRTADVMLGALFAAAAVLEALFSDSVEGHVALRRDRRRARVRPARRPAAHAAAARRRDLHHRDPRRPTCSDRRSATRWPPRSSRSSSSSTPSAGTWTAAASGWASGSWRSGLAGVVLADTGAPGDFLYVLVLSSMPALAGRAVRSRVLLQRELRVKALRLQADREERALRARWSTSAAGSPRSSRAWWPTGSAP